MLCAAQRLQGRLLGLPRGADGGALADARLAQIQARGRVMRLLAAMAGAKHGGAEAFFERLVLAFQRAGVEQQAVIRADAARAERLRGSGVGVLELKFGGWLDFRTRPALSRVIAEFRPAIALSFMSRAADAMPAPWGASPFIHIGRLGGYYDLK